MHWNIEDILEKCISCKETHSADWFDEWSGETHYKAIKCSCGYITRIPTGVMTSGLFRSAK